MTQEILVLLMETILTIAAPLAWIYVGYSLADWRRDRKSPKRGYQIQLEELTPEEAYAILNAYRESRLRHPSMRNRHPEMDDDE